MRGYGGGGGGGDGEGGAFLVREAWFMAVNVLGVVSVPSVSGHNVCVVKQKATGKVVVVRVRNLTAAYVRTFPSGKVARPPVLLGR